jgi:hypothetical protein
MKRDLNFFAAYKNGPAKTSGKSNAGLFLLIAIFIFIISGTYGGLFLYQKSIQLEINMIKAQVGDSSEKQQELAAVIEKNELLKLYTKVLADSKGKFDSSIFINKQKLTSIASAMGYLHENEPPKRTVNLCKQKPARFGAASASTG